MIDRLVTLCFNRRGIVALIFLLVTPVSYTHLTLPTSDLV